jgi:quercetin dioxygenase-like cupin family protein
MGAHGIVVQPGEGLVSSSSTTSGREYALKLLGNATGDSIMMFEETVPAGTKSTFHLHHDSDEVAYVLSGEVTFMIGGEVTVGGPGAYAFMPRGVPHAWKSTGAETGPGAVSLHPGQGGRVARGATPDRAHILVDERARAGRHVAALRLAAPRPLAAVRKPVDHRGPA